MTLGEQTVGASAADAATAKIDTLTNKIRELETSLGRAFAKNAKLETQLDHARAQVAWFQRNLFGQKRERVDTELLQGAWREFLKAQEAAARGDAPPLPEPSNAMQLLLMLGKSESGAPPTTTQAALDAAGVPAGEAPPPGAPEPKAKPKPKRHAHGRKKLPGQLRTEKVVLNPELNAEGVVKDVEISYRIGIRPAEVYAIEIHRPRVAIELASGETRYESAPPPFEMIDRGLFSPSGLAHIIASKWDRHVPWARLETFFVATALVVALDRVGVPNTAAVRSGLSLSLFRAGSISVASAAQVAGLPLPRFLEILSSLKIPVVEGGSVELHEDLANARLWLNSAP